MKNDWMILGEYPIPWFHTCYMDGLAVELKQNSGVGLSSFSSDYHDGGQRMYALASDWNKAGEEYFQTILQDPEILKEHLNRVVEDARNLERMASQLRAVNPRECSDAELLDWLRQFHAAKHPLWTHGMVPNLLEWNQGYLSGFLKEQIQQHDSTITQEELQILLSPIQLSWMQKAERELFRLASTLALHDDLGQAAATYHTQFAWTEYGWTGPMPSLEDFTTRLESVVKVGDAAQQLEKLLNADEEHRKKQQKLEQRLSLSKELMHLLTLLRRVLFEKTVRVDAFYQGYSAFEPFLKELARRNHASVKQLSLLYIGDLILALEHGTLDPHLLNEAEQFSARVLENGTLRFYTGAVARKKLAPVVSSLPKPENVGELKGDIAYPGTVRGTVKIVFHAGEMQKVEEGDVLVSQSTDPSILPAMKKAAAFVTDVGGLTCHAAIVAREMKKPCIVGVKMGTKILKDGDRVEVDATKGIVRKL